MSTSPAALRRLPGPVHVPQPTRSRWQMMPVVATAPRPTGISRYVSLFGAIRPYERSWLSQDVVAGVTLAALAIPEVMGYTKIAGTPVITGLYTILLPVLAFAVFGSSRHLVVGGDSATAAIMFAGIAAPRDRRPPAGHAAVARAGQHERAARRRVPASSRGWPGSASSPTSSRARCWSASSPASASRSRWASSAGCSACRLPTSRPTGRAARVIKFWDTLKEIGQTSGATLAVSVAVLATLIVFERWIKAIPGGLVAVVGAIAVSWVFDLSAHGVSILGPVPSGLPDFGFPSGVELERRRRRCSPRPRRCSSSSSPRAPRRRAPTPSSTGSGSSRTTTSSA